MATIFFSLAFEDENKCFSSKDHLYIYIYIIITYAWCHSIMCTHFAVNYVKIVHIAYSQIHIYTCTWVYECDCNKLRARNDHCHFCRCAMWTNRPRSWSRHLILIMEIIIHTYYTDTLLLLVYRIIITIIIIETTAMIIPIIIILMLFFFVLCVFSHIYDYYYIFFYYYYYCDYWVHVCNMYVYIYYDMMTVTPWSFMAGIVKRCTDRRHRWCRRHHTRTHNNAHKK